MKRLLYGLLVIVVVFSIVGYAYKKYTVRQVASQITSHEQDEEKTKEPNKEEKDKDHPIDQQNEEPQTNPEPPPEPEVPTPTPQAELIPYNGPVEHIFFHPLVIYPSLAFDGDAMTQGYDEYFVTVKEFNAMIQSLYEKNFILIKMSDLFDQQLLNGKKSLIKKELKLPKGKKPLILSVDDINYYQYMIENGNAYKLIIDKNGNLATYSKDLSGNAVISEENEIVPILNAFVKEHPDFSLNGAKGILALTGYEGVLGYRTNELNSSNYEQEKEEAIKIIQKLKRDGWEFASHGYGHLTTKSISLQTLKMDTERWLKEVAPLLNGTSIYIYPFGSSVLPGDPKFQYLEDAGFNVFCSVGPNPYLKYTDQYAMMDRVHIDGIGLETQQHILNRFFDSDAILDPERFQYLKR